MREQRIGVHRPVRQIQRGGELMAAFACELKAFSRHGLFSLDRVGLQSPE